MDRNALKKSAVIILLIILFHHIPLYAASYVDEMLAENEGLYRKILDMPFNNELVKGTLDENIFRNYIIQDYIYLHNYRKVFSILLAKAPDEKGSAFILYLIKSIDNEIKDVHGIYLKKFDIDEDQLINAIPYPVTEFYCSYLIKTAAIEPFEVGLAATLPCHWVYYRIGLDMNKLKISRDNKYRQWIKGYEPEPGETRDINAFIDLLGNYMRDTTDKNREKMRHAFDTAMKLEYMFWDSIYRDVKWIQ